MPICCRECPCGTRYDVLLCDGKVVGNLDAEDPRTTGCHAVGCFRSVEEAKVIIRAPRVQDATHESERGYPRISHALGIMVGSREEERRLCRERGMVEDDRTWQERVDASNRAAQDAREHKVAHKKYMDDRAERLTRDGTVDKVKAMLQSEAYSPENIIRAATDKNFRLGKD